MNIKLSITDILTSSFKTFGKNWVKIILAQLFLFAILLAPLMVIVLVALASGFMSSNAPDHLSTVSIVLITTSIIGYLLYTAYLQAGFTRFYLALFKDQNPHITSILKTPRSLFLTYLLFSVVLFLIIFGGFLLLIVPAIIFSLMYSLSKYYVLDQGMNTKQALQQSKKVTKGHKTEIFLLCLVFAAFSLVLGFLGGLGTVLSYLVLQPVILFSFITIYTKLTDQALEEKSNTEIVVQPLEIEAADSTSDETISSLEK